jgi:transcriptional regulator with XRE-family HTH domain
MDNFVRKVRKTLGLLQPEFAKLIGVAYSTLQGYEAGRAVPAEVEERVREIAAEKGLQVGPRSDVPRGGDEGAKWHDLLDEVLNSGELDCVDAVQSNLAVFASTIRSRREIKILRKKA